MATLRCTHCDGDGWIRTQHLIPAFVYGEPRMLTFSKVCGVCRGTGKIKLKPPPRDRDGIQ